MPKKNKQARKKKSQEKIVMYFNKDNNKDMVLLQMIKDFCSAMNAADGPSFKVGAYSKMILEESLLQLLLAATESVENGSSDSKEEGSGDQD